MILLWAEDTYSEKYSEVILDFKSIEEIFNKNKLSTPRGGGESETRY